MWKVVKGLSDALEFNRATLSGAIDVVVIRQPDGALVSTPFHVRFGKLQLLRSREKVVTIVVNGKAAPFFMKLGATGEAYFVEETEVRPPPNLLVSPQTTPMTTPLDTPHPSALDIGELTPIPPADPAAPAPLRLHALSDGELDAANAARPRQGSGAADRLQLEQMYDGRMCLSDEEYHHHQEEPVSSAHANFLVNNFEERELGEQSPSRSWLFFWGQGRGEGAGKNENDGGKGGEEDEEDDGEEEAVPAGLVPHGGDNEEGGDNQEGPTHPERKPRQKHKRHRHHHHHHHKGKHSGEGKADGGAEGEGVGEGDAQNENTPEAEPVLSPEPANQGPEVSFEDDALRSGRSGPRKGRKRGANRPARDSLPRSPVELSMCAQQLNDLDGNVHAQEAHRIFDEHVIPYENFADNPEVLFDDKVCVRFNSRIMSWSVAAPVVMSLLVYGKELPEEVESKLLQGDPLAAKKKRGWWFWRGRDESEEEGNAALPEPADNADAQAEAQAVPSPPQEELLEALEPREEGEVVHGGEVHEGGGAVGEWEGDEGGPEAFVQSDTDSYSSAALFAQKTTRPTTEMLEVLDLNDGCNTLSFEVTSSLQGKQMVTCRLFLWNYTDKLVISDVDGTITRSDVLGHLLPAIGKDWSHTGVASLFTKLNKHGYKMLYLTSRAIGQANATRAYLQSVKQNSERLPDGPCLMSPDSLLHAFTREVILRRPELFKIDCLQDVRALFPEDHNPFYAGFGNRHTDVISYTQAGVPQARIFIIDPSGTVHHTNRTFSKSYPMLEKLANEMFPQRESENSSDDEGFDDFNYWRPMDVQLSDESEQEDLEAQLSAVEGGAMVERRESKEGSEGKQRDAHEPQQRHGG